MEKDNATVVLTGFVKRLGVRVTRQSISDELQKHPHYGSLLAFNDVLNNYRVTSDAYQVPFTELPDIQTPFVAYLTGNRLGMVTSYNEHYVKLTDESASNKKLSHADFEKLYRGAILIAEKSKNAGESDYVKKHRLERLSTFRQPIALTGITLLVVVFFLQYTNFSNNYLLPQIALFLSKTVGLVCSILLLIQSIDANNPLIRRFCSSEENKDCNAILSSKAAKVTSYLSWSEVGFFYFAGTWLVLLFAGSNVAILRVLALLNLVSLPYSFFSIYYQWRIAKQWCIFCCAIQALLWLEFFSFLPFLLNGRGVYTTSGFITLAAGLSLPVFGWMLIKPVLTELMKTAPFKTQLRRFKYNKELFNTLLMKEKFFELPDAEWCFVLGNRNASNIVVMITNPHCKYCEKAQKTLDELLNSRDDLQARIVFTSKAERKQKQGYSVIRQVMALNETEGALRAKEALAVWHTRTKKYLEWINDFPVVATDIANYKAARQAEWCDRNRLTTTPEFFVNGYKLPKLYDINDIQYLLR